MYTTACAFYCKLLRECNTSSSTCERRGWASSTAGAERCPRERGSAGHVDRGGRRAPKQTEQPRERTTPPRHTRERDAPLGADGHVPCPALPCPALPCIILYFTRSRKRYTPSRLALRHIRAQLIWRERERERETEGLDSWRPLDKQVVFQFRPTGGWKLCVPHWLTAVIVPTLPFLIVKSAEDRRRWRAAAMEFLRSPEYISGCSGKVSFGFSTI